MTDAHCKTGGLVLASASAVDRSDSSDASDSSGLSPRFSPGTPAFRGRIVVSHCRTGRTGRKKIILFIVVNLLYGIGINVHRDELSCHER